MPTTEKQVRIVKTRRPKAVKAAQASAWPQRVILTEEETLKRMASFDERREEFIASIRKGTR